MKIAFLGDSIRLNYTPRTIELLGEGHDYFSPTDNCRFALYTARLIWDWRATLTGSDVIHWNNGLWDLCDLWGDGPFNPIERYVEMMVENARRLLTMTKTLIFATTTPVSPKNPHDRNEVIEAANAALVPRLREMGVVINDLHAVIAADIDSYICADTIHLSPAGIETAAQHNAAFIKAYL